MLKCNVTDLPYISKENSESIMKGYKSVTSCPNRGDSYKEFSRIKEALYSYLMVTCVTSAFPFKTPITRVTKVIHEIEAALNHPSGDMTVCIEVVE